MNATAGWYSGPRRGSTARGGKGLTDLGEGFGVRISTFGPYVGISSFPGGNCACARLREQRQRRELQRARQRRAGVRRPACPRAPGSPCSTPATAWSRRRNANDRGGALFRNVAAGERLPRPPRLHQRDVRAADGADDAVGAAVDGRLQPDDPDRRLRLPDHARRHQAGLLGASADGRLERPRASRACRPTRPATCLPAPTLIEYSGYGYARPEGPAERDRDPRQPDGVHGRRRQHARHRLLGRGVRLLRAAAEPRRLRHRRDGRPSAVGRPQQGRDARHLLRRHQPALHRPDSARRAWPRSRPSR